MQNANYKKAFLILSYSECEWLLFWFLLCTLVILPEVCLPPTAPFLKVKGLHSQPY